MNPFPPVQDTSPFFNNTLPHPTIELTRTKIFKTSFRKLSILTILGMTQMAGGGDDLVCVIMTHCVRRSICDSPLTLDKIDRQE